MAIMLVIIDGGDLRKSTCFALESATELSYQMGSPSRNFSLILSSTTVNYNFIFMIYLSTQLHNYNLQPLHGSVINIHRRQRETIV